MQWSPRGNLLATIHRQGVAVWGGPSFARLQRFNHAGVRLIEFSPNEKYLITYSSQEPIHMKDSATVTLTVFDVRSGRKLRVFEGSAEEFAIGANAGEQACDNWALPGLLVDLLGWAVHLAACSVRLRARSRPFHALHFFVLWS